MSAAPSGFSYQQRSYGRPGSPQSRTSSRHGPSNSQEIINIARQTARAHYLEIGSYLRSKSLFLCPPSLSCDAQPDAQLGSPPGAMLKRNLLVSHANSFRSFPRMSTMNCFVVNKPKSPQTLLRSNPFSSPRIIFIPSATRRARSSLHCPPAVSQISLPTSITNLRGDTQSLQRRTTCLNCQILTPQTTSMASNSSNLDRSTDLGPAKDP